MYPLRAPRLHTLPTVCALAMIVLMRMSSYAVNRAPELPLDDAYIYLQFAKQLAEGHLYQYVTGEGWTAGSTSPLYPFLLAPLFWFFQTPSEVVEGALLISSFFYLTAVQVGSRLGARLLGGSPQAGLLAGVSLALSGPFVWGSLSGLEIPVFALCTLATTLGLSQAVFHPEEELPVTPRWLPLALLGLSLARPEGFGLAVLAILAILLHPSRIARLRPWLLWPLILLPYLLVGLGNRIYSGQLAPNTAVHKSILYNPDLNLPRLLEHLSKNGIKLVGRLFPEDLSRSVIPLGGLGLLLALGWLTWRALSRLRKGRVGLELWVLLTIGAGSGAALLGPGPGQFARYHHISIALLAISSGVSLLALLTGLLNSLPSTWPLRSRLPAQQAWIPALALTLILGGILAPRWGKAYARSTEEIHQQQVKLAQWVDQNLPADARILLNDAGALAFYPQRPVVDLCGLVSNHFARAYRQDSGSLFEALERLPPERQPTHAALYPGWFELQPLLGPKITEARLTGRRVVAGGQVMELFPILRERLGSGERPLQFSSAPVLDQLDVASLESEQAHHYALLPEQGKPGSWLKTFLKFAVRADKTHVLDGGRPVQVGESYSLEAPAQPGQQLVLRLNGTRRVTLEVNGVAQSVAIPLTPRGQGFVDVAVPLPPSRQARLELTVRSPTLYQSFHAWVLGPEALDARPQAP